MEDKSLNISNILVKILKVMNGRNFIEIEELDGVLTKKEMLYMLVNIYNFDILTFSNIDTKRFILMENEYYVPYMKIYVIGINQINQRKE